MFQKHLVSLVLLIGASFVLFPAKAVGQSWDAFPELAPGQHLRIKKRYDGPKYDDLRRCLRRVDSKVGAEYFAAIVDVTAESGSRSREEDNALPYAVALADEWKERGLDEEKHVLFVTGLRNRSFAIKVGDAWKRIGFDGEIIADTLATSEYEKFARRRDYAEAFCSLAVAVDFRLAALRQRMDRRIEDVRATFPQIKERYDKLVGRVAETVPGEIPYGDPLRENLETVKKKLDEAEAKVEDDPTASVRLVDQAEETMDSVDEQLDEYQSVMKELETVKNELDELAASIVARSDADWQGPIEATETLDGCREKVQKIEKNLEGTPAEVRVCLEEVRARLARADVHHHYLAGVFPTIAAIALALILALLITALFMRRRRVNRLLKRDLEIWQNRLDDAHRRLQELTRDFPDYFAAADRVWQGESADLGARTADAINLAYHLYHEGLRLYEESKALSSKHPLEVFKLEKAARLIREREIALAQGARVGESPISISVNQPYSAQSASLPGDLVQSVADARRYLNESAEIMARVNQVVGEMDQLAESASAAVRVRGELGADNAHLVEPLNQIIEAYRAARTEAMNDPIRADRGDLLSAVRGPLEAVHDRAQLGNQVLEDARGGLGQRRQKMAAFVTSLEQSGVSVVEQGFDAHAQLSLLESMESEIEALVGAGREEDASARHDELREKTDELEASLRMIAAGRELVAPMTEMIEKMKDDLKGDILKLRIALGKDGVEVDEDHLSELSRIQGSLVRLAGDIGRIRKLHGDGETLASVRELATVVELFESGAVLVVELSNRFGVDTRLESAEISWPEGWAQIG